MNIILKSVCCVALTSVLCQCSSDLPPMAGTLKKVDPLAQKYLAEAKQQESQNKIKKAISKYEDIVDDCPLSVEAPYARLRMGQLREQLDDPIEAFDQYQKLIERYPDSAYYSQALQRQKELAYGAATGKLSNKLFWTFNVKMDPSIVIKWLNHICDNAPFSSSAPEAKKVLGDYLAQRDRIPEAIEAYQSIVDNYPNSPFAPVAQLTVAGLYSNMRQSGDLSYNNIAKSQEAYEEFLQRYPNHAESAKARQGLAKVRKQLVDRKLEIGEYYMNRMKDMNAAIFCFEEVVAEEKTHPQAAAAARKYLAKLKPAAKTSQKVS